MTFTCKKTENCFSDSQTYEYKLPVTMEQFRTLLDESWSQRCNQKLRRPVFLAEKGNVRLKGVLAGTNLRVSYLDSVWQQEKQTFESWLEGIQ